MSKPNKVVTLIYLILSTIVFSALFFNVPFPVHYLYYGFIVLSFIYSIIISERFTLLNWGIALTLIADTFLVLLGNSNYIYQIMGVLFFGIAQLFYFVFLFLKENVKVKKIHVIVRVSLTLIMCLLTKIVLKENCNLLSILSIFYITNLVINVVFSFLNFKQMKIFAIGLLCFTLCDLSLGFAYLDGFFNVSNNAFISFFMNPPIDLSWFFYIPSQVLINLFNNKIQNNLTR